MGSSSSFSDKIASVNGSLTALQSPYGNTVVSNGKVAPVPTKMPKHIQMGTGFRTLPAPHCTSATVLPPSVTQKPDLLSEAAHNVSRNSVNTTTTTSLGKPDSSTSSNHSHGSYKMAMENIIEDYVDGRYYFIYRIRPAQKNHHFRPSSSFPELKFSLNQTLVPGGLCC